MQSKWRRPRQLGRLELALISDNCKRLEMQAAVPHDHPRARRHPLRRATHSCRRRPLSPGDRRCWRPHAAGDRTLPATERLRAAAAVAGRDHAMAICGGPPWRPGDHQLHHHGHALQIPLVELIYFRFDFFSADPRTILYG